MRSPQYGNLYCISLKLRIARASAELRAPNSTLSFAFALILWLGLIRQLTFFDKHLLLKIPEYLHSYFLPLFSLAYSI